MTQKNKSIKLFKQTQLGLFKETIAKQSSLFELDQNGSNQNKTPATHKTPEVLIALFGYPFLTKTRIAMSIAQIFYFLVSRQAPIGRLPPTDRNQWVIFEKTAIWPLLFK